MLEDAPRTDADRFEDWGLAMEQLVSWQRDVSALRNGPLKASRGNITAYSLAMVVETGELLNELNWKPWKPDKVLSPMRVMDEFADITAFYLILQDLICQELGVTPWELLDAYISKSDVNRARLNGEVPGYEKEGRPCTSTGGTATSTEPLEPTPRSTSGGGTD